MSRWRDYLDYQCWEITITRVTEAKREREPLQGQKAMCMQRNFIFLCIGNEFALYLPAHFSLPSRGATLHSQVLAACVAEGVMISKHGNSPEHGKSLREKQKSGPSECSLAQQISPASQNYPWEQQGCKDQYNFLFCSSRPIVSTFAYFHFISYYFSSIAYFCGRNLMAIIDF